MGLRRLLASDRPQDVELGGSARRPQGRRDAREHTDDEVSDQLPDGERGRVDALGVQGLDECGAVPQTQGDAEQRPEERNDDGFEPDHATHLARAHAHGS